MKAKSAYSTLEVVVVLAILGVVGALWTWWIRPPIDTEARRLATALARLRHVTVASGAAAAELCATSGSPSELRPAVGAISWPPRGLLFTPDGLPRTCDGGGVGNTTILLEHRGRQAAVIVSSLGRVRWELR